MSKIKEVSLFVLICLFFCFSQNDLAIAQAATVVSDEAKEDLWQDVRSVPPVEAAESYEQQNRKRYDKLVTLVDGLGAGVDRIDHRVLDRGVGQEQAIPNIVFKVGTGVKPTIVVGAHLDKVAEVGTGVIDDWTGCANIIHTAKLLLAQDSLEHNFVFVCFAYEEKSLWGSQTFVNDLKLQRNTDLEKLVGGLSNIKAMINFECLGVSELYGWKEGSTVMLTDIATAVSNSIAGVNFTNRDIGLPVGADSVPFFYEGIPCVTIDSLKVPDDFSKIHSALDDLSEVREAKIKSTLEFSFCYLLKLDSTLGLDFVKTGFTRSFLEPPERSASVRFESFGHSFHTHKPNRVSGDQSKFASSASSRSELLAVELNGKTFVVWLNANGKLRKLEVQKIPDFP